MSLTYYPSSSFPGKVCVTIRSDRSIPLKVFTTRKMDRGGRIHNILVAKVTLGLIRLLFDAVTEMKHSVWIGVQRPIDLDTFLFGKLDEIMSMTNEIRIYLMSDHGISSWEHRIVSVRPLIIIRNGRCESMVFIGDWRAMNKWK